MNNRKHVKGNAGPRRHELPTFEKLDYNVAIEVMEEARGIAFSDAPSDLGTANYKISMDCPVTDMVPTDYKLILLQTQEPESDQEGEINYTVWKDGTAAIRDYLESMFGTVYQTRITVTPPGGEITWHIDLNTSIICRVQIGVDMVNSEFQFKRRGEVESLWIDDGETWFLNTGWSHRVLNHSTTESRVVIITEVLYKDLKLHF
jgi:hypothetical protein